MDVGKSKSIEGMNVITLRENMEQLKLNLDGTHAMLVARLKKSRETTDSPDSDKSE